MSFKKKFKTAQTLKAWSIVSSHVLMSSVLTFRFFMVNVFSTFFIFIFWVTVFSTFHFHTNKDALSCHTVWPNFLSCFHFQKNKVPKFLVLSHGLTSKDPLSMSRRLTKKQKEKTYKREKFCITQITCFLSLFFSQKVSHRCLVSAKLKAPVKKKLQLLRFLGFFFYVYLTNDKKTIIEQLNVQWNMHHGST